MYFRYFFIAVGLLSIPYLLQEASKLFSFNEPISIFNVISLLSAGKMLSELFGRIWQVVENPTYHLNHSKLVTFIKEEASIIILFIIWIGYSIGLLDLFYGHNYQLQYWGDWSPAVANSLLVGFVLYHLSIFFQKFIEMIPNE